MSLFLKYFSLIMVERKIFLFVTPSLFVYFNNYRCDNLYYFSMR